MTIAVPYVKPIAVDITQPLVSVEARQDSGGPVVIPPSVSAGGPYSGISGTAIQLDGTVTPGDDPSPVVLWSIVSGGTGTFSSASNPDATFTPTSTGTYILQLSVDPNTGPPVIDMTTLSSNSVGSTYYILAQNNDRLLTQNGLNLMVSQGAP